MGRLVAVVARGGPAFVDALRRAWDAGDAVLPVDPRLPATARDALLAELRPTVLVDPGDPAAPSDEVALDDGAPPVDDGDALVVPTSGTTGSPKGAVLTHAALTAHARTVHAHLAVGDGDRWLACLPLAHVGGLGVVVRALVDDIELVAHDGFDADAVRKARSDGATLVSLVPTALDRVGTEGFRWVVLGGSSDPTRDRPANVVRTWGLTETGGGIVYDGMALAGVQVEAVDGELWVRSPTLARGLRQPDGAVLDRRVGHPSAEGTWLPTGDAGSVDPDGQVTVQGRVDDMIVTGGENVWPEAVETVLRRHPAVAEVAVAGRPDPQWGSRVVAWVIPVDDAEPPTLEDLRRAVGDELPRWCAPRALHLVTDLPRTPLGKVRRAALPGL